jgi:hypothetical protein
LGHELQSATLLAGGAERAYSALAFSHSTIATDASTASSSNIEFLASIGSSPDFTLTLWDWRSGAAVLRCKAFSQEVYGVQFSPFFPGSLVTFGMGHIRFWKMADTFTGLKLQEGAGFEASRGVSQQLVVPARYRCL